jgi:CBS domain-containing protein
VTCKAIAVRPGCPVEEVARVPARYRIAALHVVDDEGCAIGAVSEKDLLRREAGRGLTVTDLLRVRAEAVAGLMSGPAVTARPEWSIAEAAGTSERHGVGRLPTVGADGRLADIVSGHDLPRPCPRGDAAPADEIRGEVLTHTLGLSPGRAQVVVDDGVVTPTGQAEAATGLPVVERPYRSVAGVVAVRSRLTSAYGGTGLDAEPPRTGAARAAAPGLGGPAPAATAGPTGREQR